MRQLYHWRATPSREALYCHVTSHEMASRKTHIPGCTSIVDKQHTEKPTNACPDKASQGVQKPGPSCSLPTKLETECLWQTKVPS
eukprot:4168237-Amphidinium_carterae.1